MSALLETDPRHAAPGAPNVAGGAPRVAMDLGGPFPDIGQAVLAHAQDDIPFLGAEVFAFGRRFRRSWGGPRRTRERGRETRAGRS